MALHVATKSKVDAFRIFVGNGGTSWRGCSAYCVKHKMQSQHFILKCIYNANACSYKEGNNFDSCWSDWCISFDVAFFWFCVFRGAVRIL